MQGQRAADAKMTENEDNRFDLVVVGSGVGGMTAALVGAISGLRTLLLEKNARVGGTSARSSGTVWIPDNPYLRARGLTDDAAQALDYLEALGRGRTERGMLEAFIAAGPEMLQFLAAHTDIAFRPYPQQADYRQELPGAAPGWRPLEPLPFDGRTLGAHFADVGWPLPELMLFGGMMITRGEAARLLDFARPWAALGLGAALTARFAADRLRFRRGTRLVLGNALVARLYRNLLNRGVVVWQTASPSRLLLEGGRVAGLVLTREERKGEQLEIHARRGVVLAGGGFPASPEWRGRYLPSPVARHTAASGGCTGDTLRLGQQAGGALGEPGEDNALWFPSSLFTRKNGETGVYPHIVLDRAKPGLVAVNAAGRRFVNEAVSYHEFCRAMYRTHGSTACMPTYLVCDRRFVWKYGLGKIRPRTVWLGKFVREGYLFTGDTLQALARRIGVAPEGLAETVQANNEAARTGTDPEFGKGESLYDRGNGDSAHGPNPCLGPMEKPPFCAVAVHPTPLGTSLGLRANPHGQVLNAGGVPIAGLYACGNDMHSPLAGEYPGAGSQLGLAMTFGYLAALHSASTGAGGT